MKPGEQLGLGWGSPSLTYGRDCSLHSTQLKTVKKKSPREGSAPLVDAILQLSPHHGYRDSQVGGHPSVSQGLRLRSDKPHMWTQRQGQRNCRLLPCPHLPVPRPCRRRTKATGWRPTSSLQTSRTSRRSTTRCARL